VNDILEVVRRLDAALGRSSAVLQREGPDIWAALEADAEPDDAERARLLDLLRVAKEVDRLGDVLAEWAVDYGDDRPDAVVDQVIADAAARLDALGVPREEGSPPRGRG
jgi:hypothetical protein